MRWFLLSALAAPTAAKVVIEAMEHDIMQIQASTFDGIISKFRDSSVSSAFPANRGDVWARSLNFQARDTVLSWNSGLWFFKDNNKEDEKFLDEYNKVPSLRIKIWSCEKHCKAMNRSQIRSQGR